MKTRVWAAAAGSVALLALSMGMQSGAATERAIREIRIHGSGPAGSAPPDDAGERGEYIYATGAAVAAGGTPAGGRDCLAEPPPAAKAAGLTKLAFCDDFSSAATIDLDGTLEDGFKWYITGLPFGFHGSSREAYRVRDGILTLSPDINQAQMSFLSAVVPKGSSTPIGWYLDREVGGWYAEARIAHAPTSVSGGFPAFWTMDMCHLYRYPRPCTRFVEPDFYEFIHGGDIRAIHLYQNATGRNPEKLDTWMAYHPNESRDVNWSSFNTVALRALPHSVHHFVNDRQVTEGSSGANTLNGTFFWVSDVVAGPRMHGDGVGRYPIIFGSGPEMPFKLDWVRVWVKP